MTSSDLAYHWRHPGLGGVDMMRACFVRHGFTRHSHETYAVGVVQDGVEEIWHGGERVLLKAGAVVMINPEDPHTGASASPDGFRYRVLYPTVELIQR